MQWARFVAEQEIRFGCVRDDKIISYDGDLFESPQEDGRVYDLGVVKFLCPCLPSKMICLWNNSRAVARKNNLTEPSHPLYFLKAANALLPNGQTIPRPVSYDGRILFEGELGIVIGRPCRGISESEAADHIFGYTCVNDVTAFDLLEMNSIFPQWTRSKNFDGFGPMGQYIATDIDPDSLIIRSVLDGRERQNYAVSDLFFAPYRLVSLLSQDMTLMPGDVIACGTSLGAVPMKPGATIEINIDGVGTLTNVMG